MTGLGVGLGPFDQLAPESHQSERAIAADFPFVMLSVPAWWAIVAPLDFALVEGGAVNPTAELAFAAFTPNRSQAARRRKAGWTVRPATAAEIATHSERAQHAPDHEGEGNGCNR